MLFGLPCLVRPIWKNCAKCYDVLHTYLYGAKVVKK